MSPPHPQKTETISSAAQLLQHTEHHRHDACQELCARGSSFSDGEDQLPGSIATFQAAAEQLPGRPPSSVTIATPVASMGTMEAGTMSLGFAYGFGCLTKPGAATSDADDAAAGGPLHPAAATAAATVWQVMELERQAWAQSTHSGLTTAASGEPRPFTWSECHNLIVTDAVDVLVRQPSVWPRVVRLQVRLQQPLLFWAERHSWLWHKKWTLPKLHVRVFCEGKPAMSSAPPPPLHVIVSAGTLRGSGDGGGGGGGGGGGDGGMDAVWYLPPRRIPGGGVSLHDQGLDGVCQRRLVQGETTFPSLLFKRTSFNCGGRPFRLVVTVLAPAHHPLAVRPAG